MTTKHNQINQCTNIQSWNKNKSYRFIQVPQSEAPHIPGSWGYNILQPNHSWFGQASGWKPVRSATCELGVPLRMFRAMANCSCSKMENPSSLILRLGLSSLQNASCNNFVSIDCSNISKILQRSHVLLNICSCFQFIPNTTRKWWFPKRNLLF